MAKRSLSNDEIFEHDESPVNLDLSEYADPQTPYFVDDTVPEFPTNLNSDDFSDAETDAITDDVIKKIINHIIGTQGIEVCIMENFKRVHDSIKSPVRSPASPPNLSESSSARWPVVSGFSSAQPSDDPAHCARPHSPPAKLDSNKFGDSAADQTCWLD